MIKLLLVDDEMDVRETLKGELEDAGYLVKTAANGADALVIVAEEPFDIILLDMLMPGIDGIQLIRVLRKWVPQVPIIGITGYIGQGYMAEASSYGVVCLSKPIDTADLLKEINDTLNGWTKKRK